MNGSNSMERRAVRPPRRLGLFLAITLLAGLFQVGTANEASAANSQCAGQIWPVVIVGNWALTSARLNCTAVGNTEVDWVEAKLYEHWGWWKHRDTDRNNANGQDRSETAEYYCAGHGRDNWRGKLKARDTAGNTKNLTGPTRNLEC